MKKKIKNVYTVPRIFWEVVKVNPAQFVASYVVSTVSAVFLGLFVSQLQNVFDNVALMVEAPSAITIKAVICSLLLLFLYKYGSQGLEIINGYMGNVYYDRCAAHFIYLYNQKFESVAAITFEDEENLNLYRKALEGAVAGRGMLHVIMDVFTMYLPYFVTISIYLVKQDPALLAILVLIAVPILITNQIKKRINMELHKKAVEPQRRKEEYAKYLSDLAYVKEVRVNCLFSFFFHRYQDARTNYNEFYEKSERKKLYVNFVTKVITLAGFLGMVLLLMQRLQAGIISVGAFGAIFYSLDEVYSMMEEVLMSRVAEYHGKLPALKAFIEMMNNETIEIEESEMGRAFTSISLKDVSFSYPNTEVPALKNINFTIEKDDKIAIVGYNGSGKSTLAKLLIGLYKPTGGSIEVDGKAVNKLNAENVSVLFQNFNQYKETLVNNIRVSELGKNGNQKTEKEEAVELLQKVYLNLTEEDEDMSFDVMCGREFGGIDLSGGQWQKLATARMLYRNRDFVVLDEPTAAIDPITEYQLFDLFEKEMQGKTGIIITHRMASIRFCNKIIVLQDGEIEAMGDHDTLMKVSPLYYQLFHSIEECYE